ncbi:MAG: hypothetical protein H7X99_04005 [Saprospiraceae bacterium]|nr:hypothetical protein [Saprospiraceae bacterium]
MNESFELIYHDLNIANSESLSEEALLEIIAERVAFLIENDKDLLLSYLYRLDIEESNIETALNPLQNDPAHMALAKLILTRQKQRVETKQKYKVEPIDEWEF